MTVKPSIKSLSAIKRKPMEFSSGSMVKTGYLEGLPSLPLIVEPLMSEINLLAWAAANRNYILDLLRAHGALLLRNFRLKALSEFEALLVSLCGPLLEYTYRSTPRSRVSGNIYTSTDYPASQSIPLHNEMAYTRHWPMKIAFHCVKSAEVGGETPIADSAKVFERIPPRIREQFIQKKVMYVRNYGERLDLPWQEVFGTNSKAEVAAFCATANMDHEWTTDGRLRTKQICQAVASHPLTGKLVWFNQAHLFHISSLAPEVRDILLAEFREEDLQRNAYYGDGSPIETSVLDEIREAYSRETVCFPWREGDIMILDNMSVAHGRTPYEGQRKIVVGMAESFINNNI